MANTQQNSTQNSRIEGLLAQYLELRSREIIPDQGTWHLDEDTLSTFVEGRLSEREASPVVSHLINCTFCRHKTVELVQLEMHFAQADEPVAAIETSADPVSVSSVLSGILSRIFGTGEAAVFAHEEKPEETKEDEENSGTDPQTKG